MNELVFFEIPKQNLKIQIVKKSDEILEQIRKESAETAVMPDVAQYYTDIYFPKAPSGTFVPMEPVFPGRMPQDSETSPFPFPPSL